MSEPDTILGWHWLAEDRRLQFGSHEVVEVCRTYTAEGPLIMCRNGMHACRLALDALDYAPGPVACRVQLTGEIQHGGGKSVARSRMVLWMVDATMVLHEFALACAEDALGRTATIGQEPDARVWAALTVKRRWLRGQATDQELATATAGARAAACSAVRDAAKAAAEIATCAVSRLATSAGRATARACWDAAATCRDVIAYAWNPAAWDAAKAAQNQILEQMVSALVARREKT